MGLRMITCEEASRLISESMDHNSPFLERLNLKMHLLMCKICPTYMRQLHLLRQILRNWASNVDRFLSDKNLTRDSKIKMKKYLHQLKQ